MCVAIVHDQKVIYSRGFGYADIKAKRETTPDTLYRIASHSKLFTAISIMQLRDGGHLHLNDPVETWASDKNTPLSTVLEGIGAIEFSVQPEGNGETGFPNGFTENGWISIDDIQFH